MPYFKLAYSKRCPIKYKELDDIYGDYEKGKARIDSKIKDEILLLTLMHEGIHAFLDESGIASASEWSGILEEFFCDMLPKFLRANFHVTPKDHLLRKN
jgi:hypothetical protein